MIEIKRKPSLSQYLRSQTPDLVDYDQARQAWYDYRPDVGKQPYLSLPNKKIKKNEIYTVSFTGAPHRLGEFNACTNSTKECRRVCIRHTGRLQMPAQMKVGLDRMEFMRLFPSEALSLIHWETIKMSKKFDRIARRLNVVTDLHFENFAPWLFEEAPDNCITYDYTKHWNRAEFPADRYRLTYSATENHDYNRIKEQVAGGVNVAVIFPNEHKDTGYSPRWHGMPVIDGDITDLRYNDPTGHVVALYAKGLARKITPGENAFVKIF